MEAAEEETYYWLKALLPVAGSHERVQWLVVGLGSGQIGDPRSCSRCQCSLAERPHGLLVAPHQVGAVCEREGGGGGCRPSYQLQGCSLKHSIPEACPPCCLGLFWSSQSLEVLPAEKMIYMATGDLSSKNN